MSHSTTLIWDYSLKRVGGGFLPESDKPDPFPIQILQICSTIRTETLPLLISGYGYYYHRNILRHIEGRNGVPFNDFMRRPGNLLYHHFEHVRAIDMLIFKEDEEALGYLIELLKGMENPMPHLTLRMILYRLKSWCYTYASELTETRLVLNVHIEITHVTHEEYRNRYMNSVRSEHNDTLRKFRGMSQCQISQSVLYQVPRTNILEQENAQKTGERI